MALAASTSSARATMPCGSGSIRKGGGPRSLTAERNRRRAARQNLQVAAGSDRPAAVQIAAARGSSSVQTLGRLTTSRSSAPSSSRPMARRHPRQRCRPRRTRRAGLSINAYVNNKNASALASSSARARTRWRRRTRSSRRWSGCEEGFPAGLAIPSPTTRPNMSRPRSNAVRKTLIEAVLLVVLVVLLFLQSWRAAIIPMLAIPVSLSAPSRSWAFGIRSTPVAVRAGAGHRHRCR
jgi:hypothetical protein